MSIVVTGIGTALGSGHTPAMLAAADRPAPATAGAATIPVHRVAADDIDPFVPRRLRRKMDRVSRITVAAATRALDDAGLLDSPLLESTGVMLDTGFGSAGAVVSVLENVFVPDPVISPLMFPNVVANASSGQVAIAFGLRGPSSTLGGVGALMYAIDLLRAGRAERLLVGGSDEVTDLFVDALAEAGFAEVVPALCDGAAFVVLERSERADERGALPYAEMVDVEVASDPGFRMDGRGAFGSGGFDRAASTVVPDGPVGLFLGSGWPSTALHAAESAAAERAGARLVLPKALTGDAFACSNAMGVAIAAHAAAEDPTLDAIVSSHDATRGQSAVAHVRGVATARRRPIGAEDNDKGIS